MKTWTKRAAGVSAIIGGLLVAGTVAAGASDLPIPVVGHATDAVSSLPLGSVTSQATPASAVAPSKAQKGSPSKPQKGSSTKSTGGSHNDTSGIANNLKAGVGLGPVVAEVPVLACGNAVAVASSNTNPACPAGKSGGNNPKGNKPPKSNPGGGTSSSDTSGILNNLDAIVNVGPAAVKIPVGVCGNAIAVASNATNGAC